MVLRLPYILYYFQELRVGYKYPGQPAEKGREKKTLVLTLRSLPEKGEKKNPGINPGQPVGKGREKKKKKKKKPRF
jgi:hypothetical protein